jgi:RNA polymerase sigma factor (sigma-70 family)
VMRVAWRTLGDAAAAEDVAQEAFLALHQRHPKGMPGASAWLHLAAAHLALNRLRGDRRRDRRERSVQETSQPADPEGEALATETRREVNAALARIPRRQAALLALRYSGLSYSEVAAALGLRVNQVGTRLRRAEAALLKEMERDHSHAPG